MDENSCMNKSHNGIPPLRKRNLSCGSEARIVETQERLTQKQQEWFVKNDIDSSPDSQILFAWMKEEETQGLEDEPIKDSITRIRNISNIASRVE